MTPHEKKTVAQLRKLARTGTQSEAARILNRTKQWVHTLAHRHGIQFCVAPTKQQPARCKRCAAVLEDSFCLRCKWTGKKIKALRLRYGLGQMAFARDILGMNIFACKRWERGFFYPSPHALRLLEDAEHWAEEDVRKAS